MDDQRDYAEEAANRGARLRWSTVRRSRTRATRHADKAYARQSAGYLPRHAAPFERAPRVRTSRPDDRPAWCACAVGRGPCSLTCIVP
jgi:hypothetical protein